MTVPAEFKLKDKKPDIDFIKWNESMSLNFDQNSYYEHSHPLVMWVEKLRLKTIVNIIKNHKEKNNLKNPTILEVGCGAGHVLEKVSNNIETKNIIGLDPLKSWLDIAKEKLNGRAKLIHGFAEDLPFENSSIDYVICTEVLEHVIDPKVVLNELKRVVKDNSFIIISIPNEKLINKLKDILDFVRVYQLFFPNIVKHNDWHIHDFELKSFDSYLPQGLKINSIITIPLVLLPLRYVMTLEK